MNKKEILAKVSEEYEELGELIRLHEEGEVKQVPEPGAWSAKDLMAHIAAWENVLLRFHIGGEPFAEVIAMPGAKYHETSFDEINAHIFKTYQTWSWAQVQEFSEQVHNALVSKLIELPEEVYGQPAESIAAIGLDPYPLFEYIAANTFDHYNEHLEALQQGRSND